MAEIPGQTVQTQLKHAHLLWLGPGETWKKEEMSTTAFRASAIEKDNLHGLYLQWSGVSLRTCVPCPGKPRATVKVWFCILGYIPNPVGHCPAEV